MTTDLGDFRPKRVKPVTLAELVCEFSDVIEPATATEVAVRGVSMDSQDLRAGEAFIAVPGEYVHAAKFAAQAQNLGAVAVITDAAGLQLIRESGVTLPVAVVADPRRAASEIAMKAYGYPARSLRTAAVTGTNGKTTTSLALAAGLKAAGLNPLVMSTAKIQIGEHIYVSERTTLEGPVLQRVMAFAREQGAQAAVIETSAHALSLHRVAGIQFDVVGFTNLQHDHLDYYHTMDNYFEAKTALFTPAHAKRAVIAVDDKWGVQMADRASVPVTTVSAYSPTATADWVITEATNSVATIGQEITLQPRSARAEIAADGKAVEIHVPLPGRANAQDTVIAYLMLTEGLGVSQAEALAGLAQLNVPGRMLVAAHATADNPMVVVDYAYTPEAITVLLDTMREFTRGKLVIVFGSDGDRDATKREPLGEAAARGAQELWITDENPRFENPAAIRAELLAGVKRVRPDLAGVHEVTTCRRDAVREAILHADPQDLVLVTGKGHELYQDIFGVKHAYRDDVTVQEVVTALQQNPRIREHLAAQ